MPHQPPTPSGGRQGVQNEKRKQKTIILSIKYLKVHISSLRIWEIHGLVTNNLELHWLIIKAMTTENLNGLNQC